MSRRPPRRRLAALAAAACMLLLLPTNLSARLLIARSVAIGQFGEGAEDFRYPVGVALLANGNFYVSDWKANRVGLYSPTGKLLRQIFPEGPGFLGPLGLTRDEAGNLYVVENRGHRIRKFDASGNQLLMIGRAGKSPGNFRYPRGVAVDREGQLYLADTSNRRIQVLDPSGAPLEMIEYLPEGAEEPLRPRDAALDPRGRLWATYSKANAVVRFGADRKPEVVFGGSGAGRGRFDQPRYLGFDVRGNVYVTDYENHRVQKFDPEGRFLYSFGARGSAPGQFHNPEGILLNTRGDIYVADTVNYRIQVLELNGIDARRNLGYAAYARGDLDEALGHYLRVLQRLPGDRESLARVEAIYRTQAREAREAGNLERALALQEKLLDVIPGHLGAHHAVRELFWRRSMPFIHSLAILGGILFSALLLMLLLFRALRDELARWWAEGGALDEGQDEDLDGPDSPAPRPLRDFAPRPGAAAGDATDEEPPRP